MRSFLRLLPLPVLLLAASSWVAADSFGFLASGDYVYYHDTRGSTDFYRGYCGFKTQDGSFVFLIRTVNLKTGKDTHGTITLTTDKKGQPKVTETDFPNGKPNAYEMQTLVDLLNFLSFREGPGSDTGYDTTVEDPWPDYVLVYHFDKILPVFGFDTITRKGDDKPEYVLDRVGHVTLKDIRDFFSVDPSWLTPYSDQPASKLEPMPSHREGLGPYSIALDDRWKPDRLIGVGGYRLQGTTPWDSQISLEESSMKHLRDIGFTEPYRYVRALLAMSPSTLTNTIKVEAPGGNITVQWVLLDKQKVRNIMRFRIWIKDDTFYTLNFSSFYGVYKKNPEYYRAIFDSFR